MATEHLILASVTKELNFNELKLNYPYMTRSYYVIQYSSNMYHELLPSLENTDI